jgi:hypothetical protein
MADLMVADKLILPVGKFDYNSLLILNMAV